MKLETKPLYKIKKSNPFFLSLWFLIIVVFLTLLIYIYDLNLSKKNILLQKEIEIKQASISKLEKNPKIIISLLYNSRENSIKKLENYSNITLFIDHVLKLSRIYSISFKWFNYSWWELSLLAISSSETWGEINYKKVSKFISEYRKNENKQALFDLALVRNITTRNDWVDNVFNINLNLKNNVLAIVKNLEKVKLENQKRLKLEQENKKKEFEKKKEALFKKKTEEKIKLNPKDK